MIFDSEWDNKLKDRVYLPTAQCIISLIFQLSKVKQNSTKSVVGLSETVSTNAKVVSNQVSSELYNFDQVHPKSTLSSDAREKDKSKISHLPANVLVLWIDRNMRKFLKPSFNIDVYKKSNFGHIGFKFSE